MDTKPLICAKKYVIFSMESKWINNKNNHKEFGWILSNRFLSIEIVSQRCFKWNILFWGVLLEINGHSEYFFNWLIIFVIKITNSNIKL